MSIYGFDEYENGSWRARLKYLLTAYERKQGDQVLEYNGLRYYLLKNFNFPEIHKVMKAGNICKILAFEKDGSFDLVLDQETYQFQLEEEGPVQGGICYYLTNLDLENSEDQRKIERMEKAFFEQKFHAFKREYWGLKDVYALMKSLPEEMGHYTSYLAEDELQKTGIADISQNTTEIFCRYLVKSFQGDRFSRMEQAGSVTDEKVTLQKVFVDLEAYKETMNAEMDGGLFVREMIRQGNCENRKAACKKEQGEYRKYLLLGTAGQGKSTACQYLVQIYRAFFLKRYLKSGLGEEQKSFLREYEKTVGEVVSCIRIPIHVVIKEYAAWMKKQREAENPCGISEYICSQICRKTSEDFSLRQFRELLKITSWFFVFDGMDEVPDSSNRSMVIQEIQDFQNNELDLIDCDYMTICTSRPQGNLEGLSASNYSRLRLKELTKERCVEYLERLVEQMGSSESEKERFMEVLQDSVNDPVVSYLMKSPLQATIVAILVKAGGKPPRDRFNLFATYYDTIKNREKQKDALESLHDSMDWIDDIHYQIAYRLQKESESDSNPSAAIDGEAFRQLIWDYIQETNGEEDAEELCEPFFHAFTERLCFITDANMEGEYMFTIRSMQEFLAANKIVREPEVIDELRSIAPTAYWRNVFLFAAGYLQKNMKARNRDIQDICKDLNGQDCTPGQYSLEKIAKAGSWLALDILLEGIYKGAQKTEKIYYDLFFEVKDQASVMKIGECSRLAPEKKAFLREEYIIPQLQREPENRVLWHLLCLTSNGNQPLEELIKAKMDYKDKLELVLYLDKKYTIAEDRTSIDGYILELLGQQSMDVELAYDKCCELLANGIEIQNPEVKRFIWKNMILHNAGIQRPLGGHDEILGLPSFWKSMENILLSCKRVQTCLRIADVINFRIVDMKRNEETISVLQEAVAWMEEQGFLTEAAFLHMMICPQKQEIQQYIHVLWQESEEDRIEWLQKHERQFYVVNWLKRQYNTRTLIRMNEEEVQELMDFDFQEKCRELREAVKNHNWNRFWKWSQLGRTSCSHMKEEKLFQYLEETNRSAEEISQMGEEELGTFLFAATTLLSDHELDKRVEEVLHSAYEEYTKRDWNLCWVNIWARQTALYLLNREDKNELFSSQDTYKVFENKEEGMYLYRITDFFGQEPKQLWENIIWMLNAVTADHVIFRVLPALCLCMPTVSLNIPNNSYRHLFSSTGEKDLKELGRLLFLMLLPDPDDEECEILTEQILEYIKKTETDSILLFLYCMDRYPVTGYLQDMLYAKMYGFLEEKKAYSSVNGRKMMARVCESAYLKVQESGKSGSR